MKKIIILNNLLNKKVTCVQNILFFIKVVQKGCDSFVTIKFISISFRKVLQRLKK